MKVDLRKAYYSSHWDFIRDLLEGMEFPKKFTDWIMAGMCYFPFLHFECQWKLVWLFSRQEGHQTR